MRANGVSLVGYQTLSSSFRISSGGAGRGLPFAAGRTAVASASSGRSSCGTCVLAQTLGARQRGQLLGARDRVAAHRLAEARDGVGRHLEVEAQRGRQADRVHRPVREPVAAAERLRHRVRRRPSPPRSAEPACVAPSSSSRRASRSRPSSSTARQRPRDQRGAGQRVGSSSGVAPATYSASAQCASAFSAVPPVCSRGRSSVSSGLVDDALDVAPPCRRA